MRERKKELVGRVVSDQMEKTVVVAVNTLRRHRLYQRTMRRTKKYMVHDESNEARVGDLVRIQESRPISRHKHWRVIDVVESAISRGKAVSLPTIGVTAGIPGVAPVSGADAAPAGLSDTGESRTSEEQEGAGR